MEGRQREWPKNLLKMDYKKRFFFIFDIYYAAWKILIHIMSYTDMHDWQKSYWDMSSLRAIWGHLGSFQLIYRLTHFSSFRPILNSYRIILNKVMVFRVGLGSFRLILAYLGLFRLIWSHLDSLELIKASLSSFRLIQAHLRLFRLIWALLCPFRLIYAHLNLF